MPSRRSSTTTPFEVQLQFSRALTVVRSLSMGDAHWRPSTQDKLRLYGLYKQALEGECHVARPSSRLVVLHAKWKAWDQLGQLSSLEAQMQYVALLIDILYKFLDRYPQHELAPTVHDSIQYLQLNSDTNPLFIESMDDGFFQHIEEEELVHPQQLTMDSTYFYNRQQPNYTSNNTPSTTYTSPVTPDDSIQQRLQRSSLQHQKQQWYERNRNYAQQQQPVDRFRYNDGISEADTIDREVAATTSGLGLVPPHQHPYQSTNQPSENALESLQTEVAALTEQLDHFRKTLAEKKLEKQRWSGIRLIKTLVKHASINLLIIVLVFLVLLKRKSPIAYALLGYIGPRIQDILRYIMQKTFFWKLTV
ncbi:acyl CoA binding protein-domain-containing protein [Chlamydoabsidia padenii]|nr:acyl CoA binding protein-domain-containing protein [Chlamydoabsidia padenii]